MEFHGHGEVIRSLQDVSCSTRGAEWARVYGSIRFGVKKLRCKVSGFAALAR